MQKNGSKEWQQLWQQQHWQVHSQAAAEIRKQLPAAQMPAKP